MTPSYSLTPSALSVLRNGGVLGVVIALHIALALWILIERGRSDDWVPRLPPTGERPLDVSFDDRPRPHPTVRGIPVPVAPRRIRKTPAVAAPVHMDAVEPAPSDSRPSDQPAAAPVIATNAGPSESMPSYSGGDPSLIRALGESGRHGPVGIPGYDTGSRIGGVVLATPSSLKDAVRAVGTTLNCNAIKMQRDRPGNATNAALARAYDEMGCTG